MFGSIRSEIFVDKSHPVKNKLRRSDIFLLTAKKMPPLRGLDVFGSGCYKDFAPTALLKSEVRSGTDGKLVKSPACQQLHNPARGEGYPPMNRWYGLVRLPRQNATQPFQRVFPYSMQVVVAVRLVDNNCGF